MSEYKIKTFEDLKLSPWLVRQCTAMGLNTPTPIQINCIPPILEGKNCIGAAKTGSGKTLAFALPIIQKLSEDPYSIFALVLTTTRELAYQIGDQFAVIGKGMNLRHCVIVGGMDMVQQGRQLESKPHIIVATPGRLADHLESCNTYSLAKIKFLVLDEADKLLGGLFNDQIQTIFKVLPKNRQSLCFSATINDTVLTLRKVIENKNQERELFMYEAPAEVATVERLEQCYLLCPVDVKDAYFVELLRTYRSENKSGSIMIFTDSCYNCQILSMTLNEVGFDNVALHGMMKQKERLAALSKFKSNMIKILIATDVASRGLDIPKVELVINHNVPKVPKDYIHRVGRTARAGRGGKAVTLITPQDIKLLQAVEDLIKTKLSEFKIDDKAAAEICLEVGVTKSEVEVKLDKDKFFERKMINLRKKWIMEGLDPEKEEKKYFKKSKKRKNNDKGKEDKKKKTEDMDLNDSEEVGESEKVKEKEIQVDQ